MLSAVTPALSHCLYHPFKRVTTHKTSPPLPASLPTITPSFPASGSTRLPSYFKEPRPHLPPPLTPPPTPAHTHTQKQENLPPPLPPSPNPSPSPPPPTWVDALGLVLCDAAPDEALQLGRGQPLAAGHVLQQAAGRAAATAGSRQAEQGADGGVLVNLKGGQRGEGGCYCILQE